MSCDYCEVLTLDKLLEISKTRKVALDRYGFPDTAYYAHHQSFQNLVSSAQNGCGLCRAILTELAKIDAIGQISDNIEAGLDTSVRICIAVRERVFCASGEELFDRLLVRVGETARTSALIGPERTIRLGLMRHKNSPPQLARLRLGLPYLGSGLGSTESFDLARKWLHTCTKQHSKWNERNCEPMRHKPLPTRIIDIGPSGVAAAPKLFLSAGHYGMYAALSHCWGNTMSVKTSMMNLDSYVQNLPIDILPRTFQDAIRITRELAFRYLWIDSICIIQDSPQDWERESAVMDLVYKNAAVTIAAAASKDSEAGILNPFSYQIKDFTQYCHLRLHPNSPLSHSVQVSSFKSPEHFYDCFHDLPLGRRGWAFQERLLSQRVLYYGRDQIYFQCRTAHLSADGVQPNPREDTLADGVTLLNFSYSEKAADNGIEVYDRWLPLLEQYCQYCVLSYSKDKLPALAGIASTFQKFTGDEYLGGIWRRDLARGLLWQIWDGCEQPDRASSWSWARWDGFVYHPLKLHEPTGREHLVELIGHDIQNRGLNPFGEVTSGSLTLRGWTIRLSLNGMLRLGEVSLDGREHCYAGYPNRHRIVGSDCVVLLIGSYHHRDQFARATKKMGMLVLKPTPAQQGVLFRRIDAIIREATPMFKIDMAGWIRQDVTVI